VRTADAARAATEPVSVDTERLQRGYMFSKSGIRLFDAVGGRGGGASGVS